MSSADPPSSASPSTVGLGYGIAIAVSILVFISTIMLVSYACIRVKSTRPGRPRPSSSASQLPLPPPSADNLVVLMLGLDRSIIESYPKLILGESRCLPTPNHDPCSICLSDYQPNDSLCCIPDFHHYFHSDCVDEWLRMSATCPLCRNSPAPTPVVTPLSEFAPLASNARKWMV